MIKHPINPQNASRWRKTILFEWFSIFPGITTWYIWYQHVHESESGEKEWSIWEIHSRHIGRPRRLKQRLPSCTIVADDSELPWWSEKGLVPSRPQEKSTSLSSIVESLIVVKLLWIDSKSSSRRAKEPKRKTNKTGEDKQS